MNHLTLRGTHREMGFQWGARLAERGLRLLDHVPFPLEAERRAFAAACRPAYARHFPAALEELEGRPRLEAAPSVWSVERRGVDLDNYVRFDWSVLAPEQYEVERNMADGDYETSFRLDWYRLSLPALAEPFARDLFSRQTFYGEIPERYTVAPLDVPDTDAVLITEEGGFGQDVLLCRGTVVFYLRYYGDQELSAHPELLAELAQFDGR